MSDIKRTRQIVILGILSALTVVLAFLPVKIFFEITLTSIPIIAASIILGPIGGLIIGSVFGIVSFLQCFGYSPLGQILLSINPFLTFLVCVPTRMLAGLIPGLLFIKEKENKKTAAILAGFLVPLLNTIFFMVMLVLCFYNTEFIQSMVVDFKATNVIHFMLLFVGFNALIELVVGGLTGVGMSRIINYLPKFK